jgi:putative ABC transport system ATP-binding protein
MTNSSVGFPQFYQIQQILDRFLDSHTSAEIMRLFKTLHQQGVTIIMVTHDEHVALQSDRMIKVLDGQIISDTEVSHANN